MPAPLAASLEDIRGLKPFLSGGANPWAIALLLVLAAVLAATLYYLAQREPTAEMPLAPLPTRPQTLRERLDALRQHPLNEMGEAIRFSEQLSEILRDFLLQRYGLSGKRLTSSELLQELERRHVPEIVRFHLASVFAACDLVKFAKVRLANAELHQHLTTAYLLLEFNESAADEVGP